MKPSSLAALASLFGALVALMPASCSTIEPTQSTYFERVIAPITSTSCVHTNTGAGCHTVDDKGNAFGNLDLSSFAGVNRRRDLLADYGPYGQPALLVKNVPPFQVSVEFYDGTPPITITTDIKHSGQSILDPTASAYQTLRRWIEDGATENNSGVAPSALTRLPCVDTIPTDQPTFNPNTDPTTADFATFKSKVIPTMQSTCSAGNCHGTTSNDLYLTCGNTPQEVRWNYFAASEYLASTPQQSEILRRPLDPSQGGSFHEGGVIFQTTQDSGYQGLLAWATAHGPLSETTTPEFDFFVHNVQPMLVKKGCMMLQCHSAAMFHEYRLRGGSAGSFSYSASQRNYAFSILQLALENDDVNASRLVQKNLYRPEIASGGHGIIHRGGPLLEDFGVAQPASAASCPDGKYTYDNPATLDSIPPYCVIREWHRRERAARNLAPMSAIVYVKRPIPSGPDRAQDYDVYSPGAELHLATATLNDAVPGGVTLGGSDIILNAGCGLDPSTADIRKPSVSWDGTMIAFAARSSASAPLEIYTANADGTSCAQHAQIDAGTPTVNGLLVHNFDPVFSPPGTDGVQRIVFASTRGNLSTNPNLYDYSGPQRTPADPTKANANIYIWEPDPNNPGQNRIRQGTFLLDMERMPTFMADGRMIMTTEKRAKDFSQLALRRMNLDGGDYHPLYAQRATIGYHEARYAIEMENKSFAVILSDLNAPHGAGTLGIFNRSIGPDFTSSNPADYVIDSSVIDPNAPASPEPAFFLHSFSLPDPTATGRAGPTNGVYTSPGTLPNANVLVSWGAATDFASFGGHYDLYVMDPSTGIRTPLIQTTAASQIIEAVAVYARAPRGIFTSAYDEPNGHTIVYEGKTEADVTVLDTPVLTSLVFQNTPTGRVLEPIQSIDVYEDLPPASGVTSFANAPPGNVASDAYGQVYVRRRSLGNVPLADDGSTHFQVPGGLPLVLHLPETSLSSQLGLPRFQREEMEFAPGEYCNQSLPRGFFNGLCGQCHGAISDRPVDVAVNPDVLTQASNVVGRTQAPINLLEAPGARGAVVGPSD